MAKRAAFIRTADWPPANESVFRALKQQFPGTEFDLIEIKKLIRKRLDIVAINVLFVVWYYGASILSRKRTFKDCFFRTPYMFRAIKKLVAQACAGKTYDFSFQMQSIFDASVAGVPHFLYTDHTHLANLYYATFDRSKLYAQSWIKLEKTIYQQTRINFTRSSNIATSIIEQYDCPAEKVATVYAGSNTETSTAPFNEQKYQSKRIIFVGIDWERKGGPELIKAFKMVLQAHPDAQLTIIGCSPALDVLNCTVVGRVPLKEVGAYYEQGALFCLPTRLEPFGIVFIEAMSRKLPIVATRIGAIPDFVLQGKNGYMVELDDIAGLAHALTTLLDNPELCRSFGEQSYQLVEQRYSWENVSRAMRAHILPAIASSANYAAEQPRPPVPST